MVKGPATLMTFPSSLYRYTQFDGSTTYECPFKDCSFFITMDDEDAATHKYVTGRTMLRHIEDSHEFTIIEPGARPKHRNYVTHE